MAKEKFNYEAIIQRLQEAAKARSLKDLANQVGVSEPTLHSWKKGKGLDLSKLEKYAEQYRIPLAELLFGRQSKNKERSGSTGAGGLEITEAERRLIQKLADDRDEPFEVVQHELLREALFRRGAEMLTNYRDLSQQNLQELRLLLNLLMAEESGVVESESAVDTFGDRRMAR